MILILVAVRVQVVRSQVAVVAVRVRVRARARALPAQVLAVVAVHQNLLHQALLSVVAVRAHPVLVRVVAVVVVVAVRHRVYPIGIILIGITELKSLSSPIAFGVLRMTSLYTLTSQTSERTSIPMLNLMVQI